VKISYQAILLNCHQLIIKNNDAFLLSQWLEKGVFDALEKAYLKSLTFAVYAKEKEKDDGILLETYQFLVEYGDEKQIKLNGVTMNRENMKKQAVTFIRCLVEFTGTLDELPDDRYLTMKLAVNPHSSPNSLIPVL
jgi:meiosis-specific protein